MNELIKEHLEKFNVEPIIIGLFFSRIDIVMDNIKEAIKDNNPYNEYEMLSKEEQKLYDSGNLLF